jgi:CheY-like chemotaxis protein
MIQIQFASHASASSMPSANPAIPAAADTECKAARSVRVLVVDDDPNVLRMLVAVLEQHDSLTVAGTAMDGSAGLRAAETLRPDLVVLDVSMPVMHGLEAAARLRSRYPAIKVLMTSADDDPDVAQACLDAGADAFARKAQFAQLLPSYLVSLFSHSFFGVKA